MCRAHIFQASLGVTLDVIVQGMACFGLRHSYAASGCVGSTISVTLVMVAQIIGALVGFHRRSAKTILSANVHSVWKRLCKAAIA